MTKSQKHWLMSSVQTFLTGFVLAILPFLSNVDLAHLEKATLIGIITAGVRAGFKALGELLIPASKA